MVAYHAARPLVNTENRPLCSVPCVVDVVPVPVGHAGQAKVSARGVAVGDQGIMKNASAHPERMSRTPHIAPLPKTPDRFLSLLWDAY